ncbi:ABC transporter permease, partial [Azospirillum brasilense]|nr:ABC transporter permease [Azospirillum brasilense]
MDDALLVVLLLADATIRVATPLVLAAFAALYSERAGVVDIGLEGKMLAGAFFAAAVASSTGNAWLVRGAAAAASVALGLVLGFACLTPTGNQRGVGLALKPLVPGLGPALALA